MTVLDGVGNRLARRNEDGVNLIRRHARPNQPVAQRTSYICKTIRVGWKVNPQRRGLAVEQERDVVLIATARGEPGHHLVRQVLQV